MDTDTEYIRGRDAVNAFFREVRASDVRVWRYHVSHSWLELLLTHEAADTYSTIHCRMTHSIELPVLAWQPQLTVETQTSTALGAVVCLTDRATQVRVGCESVEVHVGQHPPH